MRLLDSFIRLLKPFDYLLFAALIVGSFLPVFSLPKLRNIQVIVTPLFESTGRRLIDSTSKNRIIDKTYVPSRKQYNIIEINSGTFA